MENPAYREGGQERKYHRDENEAYKVPRNAGELNPRLSDQQQSRLGEWATGNHQTRRGAWRKFLDQVFADT